MRCWHDAACKGAPDTPAQQRQVQMNANLLCLPALVGGGCRLSTRRIRSPEPSCHQLCGARRWATTGITVVLALHRSKQVIHGGGHCQSSISDTMIVLYTDVCCDRADVRPRSISHYAGTREILQTMYKQHDSHTLLTKLLDHCTIG